MARSVREQVFVMLGCGGAGSRGGWLLLPFGASGSRRNTVAVFRAQDISLFVTVLQLVLVCGAYACGVRDVWDRPGRRRRATEALTAMMSGDVCGGRAAGPFGDLC